MTGYVVPYSLLCLCLRIATMKKRCLLVCSKLTQNWWPSVVNLDSIDGLLPPACKFDFEEVAASSVKIILIDKSSFKDIKGYKLWYKSNEELLANDPVCEVPNNQKRILLSNLQPGKS
ncbi:hypothetical protein K1719_016656 [Acacia pycnantha]|nr:hypothetical protein K1719_016656 [Acacia pycnantha]